MYTYVCIDIYIYIERDIDIERDTYVCIYIYIYTYNVISYYSMPEHILYYRGRPSAARRARCASARRAGTLTYA